MLYTKQSVVLYILFLTVVHPLMAIPLYYWQKGKRTENFGDRLSLELVSRIAKTKIGYASCNSRHKKLLAIGSILRCAKNNDVIWGSGVNGKSTDPKLYHFDTLDIRAVRGPLTRKFIQNNFHINCPEIYGDPALLLPYFFHEFKKPAQPLYPYIIIPHYSEKRLFPKSKFPNVVYPTEPWDVVVHKIVNSGFVISSSLHGIVVAEAYGIPARLLKVTNHEPLFKYTDYYYGTKRFDFKYATSVEQALEMGGEPPAQCNLHKLYKAFPKEFWPTTSFRKLKKESRS